MDIDFEHYKVFYHVAHHLSFSEAAKKLFISQSAVSQAIKSLEKKMQTQLFRRSTKQVQLTREGEMLFQHIAQAFNIIKTAERNIEELHQLQSGEVRIGASDTICKYYLTSSLKKFHNLHPNVTIHIINRTSLQCMELLKNGLVDVSVINTPADLQIPGIKMEVIKPLQDRFICGNQYPELIERPVTLKELERYPFLMLEKNTMTRKFFDRFIQECGVHITPEIELGSMDLLVELVCINLGISFVLNDCLHHYLDRGKIHVINIRETIPTRYLAVISPAQIPVSIAARKFIQHLSEPPSSES